MSVSSAFAFGTGKEMSTYIVPITSAIHLKRNSNGRVVRCYEFRIVTGIVHVRQYGNTSIIPTWCTRRTRCIVLACKTLQSIVGDTVWVHAVETGCVCQAI